MKATQQNAPPTNLLLLKIVSRPTANAQVKIDALVDDLHVSHIRGTLREKQRKRRKQKESKKQRNKDSEEDEEDESWFFPKKGKQRHGTCAIFLVLQTHRR